MMNNRQIDEAIKEMTQRKSKLMKLKQLNTDVAALELNAIQAPHEIKDSVSKIESLVTAHFNVTAMEMRSRARPEHLVIPRHLIFYLNRRYTPTTLETIGRAYSRDHGAVIHGSNRTKEMMETNAKFKAEVEGLEAECRKVLGLEAQDPALKVV